MNTTHVASCRHCHRPVKQYVKKDRHKNPYLVIQCNRCGWSRASVNRMRRGPLPNLNRVPLNAVELTYYGPLSEQRTILFTKQEFESLYSDGVKYLILQLKGRAVGIRAATDINSIPECYQLIRTAISAVDKKTDIYYLTLYN